MARMRRFGAGRMNGVLRGLGQEFDDLMPATTVGVDTVQSADAIDYTAQLGPDPNAPTESTPLFVPDASAPVTVASSLPAATPDMLNKLVQVGQQVYKYVQGSNGQIVAQPTAVAPVMTFAGLTPGKIAIGAAILYLLLG